jgi:cytochrome P450
MTEDEVTTQIRTLLVAGYETTSGGCILLLISISHLYTHFRSNPDLGSH